MVERQALAKSTGEVSEDALALFGWPLNPLPDFAPCFEPLGAVIDLVYVVPAEQATARPLALARPKPSGRVPHRRPVARAAGSSCS